MNAVGKRVDVTIRGMYMTMKLTEVAFAPKAFKPSVPSSTQAIKASSAANSRFGPKMSKMARTDEEADMQNRRSTNQSSESKKSDGPVMRLSSNTVDYLGKSMFFAC